MGMGGYLSVKVVEQRRVRFLRRFDGWPTIGLFFGDNFLRAIQQPGFL